MKNRIIPHLALFTVALIYGGNYIIAKGVMNGGFIHPLGFIFFRVFTGLIIFQFVSQLFIKEKIEKKDWGRFMLCGLFGVAINQMFFFMGLERTTPIHASLIMLSTPFVVLIASRFIIKSKITWRKVIGICIGSAGALLLILKNSAPSGDTAYLSGDLMIFINATSYGLYLVLVKPLASKYHPITIVSWVFTFGAIVVVPFGISHIGNVDWQSFLPNTWLSFFYVLLFTTVLAYLLNAFALQKISPSIASVYIYLQPLIAGTISILVGQDQLHVQIVLAALLIFLGVFLVSGGKKG